MTTRIFVLHDIAIIDAEIPIIVNFLVLDHEKKIYALYLAKFLWAFIMRCFLRADIPIID